MFGKNMQLLYANHKSLIWFLNGFLLAVILMFLFGLTYDYVCYSFIQENLLPVDAPGLLGRIL